MNTVKREKNSELYKVSRQRTKTLRFSNSATRALNVIKSWPSPPNPSPWPSLPPCDSRKSQKHETKHLGI